MWILEAMLRVNDWEHFEVLFSILGTVIDFSFHEPLLKCIFDLIEWIINPIYCKISPSRYFPEDNSKIPISFKIEENSPSEQFEQGNSIHDLNMYKTLAKVIGIIGFILLFFIFTYWIYILNKLKIEIMKLKC